MGAVVWNIAPLLSSITTYSDITTCNHHFNQNHVDSLFHLENSGAEVGLYVCPLGWKVRLLLMLLYDWLTHEQIP